MPRIVLHLKKPFDRVLRLQQDLDEMAQRLVTAEKHAVELERERLIGMVNRLESVSPLKVLSRGYSIATTVEDNKLIKSSIGLTVGKMLRTRFSHGGVVSTVVEVLK